MLLDVLGKTEYLYLRPYEILLDNNFPLVLFIGNLFFYWRYIELGRYFHYDAHGFYLFNSFLAIRRQSYYYEILFSFTFA